ncbi:MAG: hypothetical protein NUV53_01450 [Patescibacteria group bacterium]|nr:hypothetical protein [Patescibacteria group bacterium]
MVTTTKEEATIPITLPQIAEGLRRLSPRKFETLALLLEGKTMRAIERIAREAKEGKLREL